MNRFHVAFEVEHVGLRKLAFSCFSTGPLGVAAALKLLVPRFTQQERLVTRQALSLEELLSAHPGWAVCIEVLEPLVRLSTNSVSHVRLAQMETAGEDYTNLLIVHAPIRFRCAVILCDSSWIAHLSNGDVRCAAVDRDT